MQLSTVIVSSIFVVVTSPTDLFYHGFISICYCCCSFSLFCFPCTSKARIKKRHQFTLKTRSKKMKNFEFSRLIDSLVTFKTILNKSYSSHDIRVLLISLLFSYQNTPARERHSACTYPYLPCIYTLKKKLATCKTTMKVNQIGLFILSIFIIQCKY